MGRLLYTLFGFALLCGCDDVDEDKLVRTYFLPDCDSLTIEHSFGYGSKFNRTGHNKIKDLDQAQSPEEIKVVVDRFYSDSKSVATDGDCASRLDTAYAHMTEAIRQPYTTLLKDEVKCEMAWYLHTFYLEKSQRGKLDNLAGSDVYAEILRGNIPEKIPNTPPPDDSENDDMTNTDIFMFTLVIGAFLWVVFRLYREDIRAFFSAKNQQRPAQPAPRPTIPVPPVKKAAPPATKPEPVITQPTPPVVTPVPPPATPKSTEDYAKIIEALTAPKPAAPKPPTQTFVPPSVASPSKPPIVPPAPPSPIPAPPPPKPAIPTPPVAPPPPSATEIPITETPAAPTVYSDIVYQIKYASQPHGKVLHRIYDAFVPYETFIVIAIDPAAPLTGQLRFTEDVETRDFVLKQDQMLNKVCKLPEQPLPSSSKDITQQYGEATRQGNHWIIQKEIVLSWK
jgi:hypothetical protein